LQAETQDSYEIGVNSKYFGIDAEISAYLLKGNNYIQETFISPAHTPVPVQFKNSGEYEFKGFEISLKKEIIKNLNVYAAYSYIDTGKIKEGAGKGQITRPVAKNKIDMSLDCKTGRFDFYLNALFVSGYYAAQAASVQSANIVKLDDFAVINAKINFNVGNGFSIFGAVDNIANAKYEMYIVSFGADRIYEMPGAAAQAGAKYKF